jgi:hypothetical protein
MSITSVENKFSSDFTNFVVSDFMIDSEDFSTAFPELQKYSIKNTAIKINVIKFEEEKNHRVSSVTIFNKELFTEANEWQLLEKIEVDNCQIVILNEDKLQDNSLEDWLESCISMKELYNVSDDGKVCITSGFGPGIYRLMGFKMNDELVAIRLEFIKEKVDENTA